MSLPEALLRSPVDGSTISFDQALGVWMDEGGQEHPHIGRDWYDAGIADLRVQDIDHEPWPATRATMQVALERLGRGDDYKPVLEELLCALDPDRADAFQLLLKESRGGWAPLLHDGVSEALFIGNSLSGTLSALAACTPARLTTMERCAERLAFASHRNLLHVGDRATPILAGDSARLPFADGSFDLVVIEEGLPGPGSDWAFGFEELERVCSGQLVLTVDNRFGYKRSSGLRGQYRVPRPIEFLKHAWKPDTEQRSLHGYRKLMDGFDALRTYSLYPHMRDFTHVVALDEERPRLTIGPRERRNIPKLLGKAVGLFPHLTPSYLLVGARGASARRRPRIELVLDELARLTGEERADLDVLVATRSNTALLQCRPPGESGAAHALSPAGEQRGRWTLHIPMSPCKRGLLAKHHHALERVQREFPVVPVPEPLFIGEIDGFWLTAERRLAGLTAPHLTGQLAETTRMFREASAHMAQLVVEPQRVLDEALFDELLSSRFELVRKHAGIAGTRRRVDELLAETRDRLLGRALPLVLYHGDLRSKHIQVTPEGEVLGYLDWGASEASFLPYVDLLHLIAHQRKQEENCSPARTWKLITERKDLRPHEAFALESYLDALGLDEDYRVAIEAIYPILVAGMAERNWDFSRPLWMHRCFGI
ncbi:MAG: SAM-dependent methyltransferase [Planctomycetota bacterium]|jgi:SAM-dependent methyltransferase